MGVQYGFLRVSLGSDRVVIRGGCYRLVGGGYGRHERRSRRRIILVSAMMGLGDDGKIPSHVSVTGPQQ